MLYLRTTPECESLASAANDTSPRRPFQSCRESPTAR